MERYCIFWMTNRSSFPLSYPEDINSNHFVQEAAFVVLVVVLRLHIYRGGDL